MPRPKRDTVQITFRIPRGWLDRADGVAAQLSRPGLDLCRTDAMRAALARGLDILSQENSHVPIPDSAARKAKKK